MYKILIGLLLCCTSYASFAGHEWKLKKEENGVKVFTANNPGCNIKSLRVEMTVNATMHQFLSFLLDISKQTEWVYSAHSSHLLKTILNNEIIFYSEIDLPWPCSNRDYIAHLTLAKPSPGLVTIDSYADPDFLPPQKGFVRVKKSVAHWDIISVSPTVQKIEYVLDFDPGGALPAWLVNLFLTKGPLYTFQKLREGVKKYEYKENTLPFLKTKG